MSETSRRKFLAVTGAGAAAGDGRADRRPGGRGAAATPDSAAESGRRLRARPPAGELRLMVGEREVVVHDRDLVTRILNAAGGK